MAAQFITSTYTFTPGASGVGTVNLSGITSDYGTFDIKRLVAIINLDRNGAIIYATAQASTRFTAVSGTTVTLFYDTSTHNSGDRLQIKYETSTAIEALDSTLTGGNQKAITRGGAKGATTAADVTSTSQSADRNALDVQIRTSSGAVVDTFGGGTQFADGAVRGTATGTLCMIDDGTNIQSMSGDSSGRPNVNVVNTIDTELPTAAALTDADTNPTAPTVGAANMVWNGTTWSRVKGNSGDGANATGMQNLLPMLFNGTTHDRLRGDITNGLDVDVTRVSGTVTTQDTSSLVDNAQFTDGTSRVIPQGFIFDDVSGTALTENDIAAARIDSKRAQSMVLEDSSIRGRNATIKAAGVMPTSTDTSLVVGAIRQTKATYRLATTANVVAAAGSAMFFVISGSATKTIKIKKIGVSGMTLTAAAYISIVVEKWSTAPTGGTATTLTKVPLDSTFAASTATLCQVYTAAPTEGTLVGTLSCHRDLFQATTAVAAGSPPERIFIFGESESEHIVLRGSTEALSLAFGAAPATAVTLALFIEYTEE